MIRIIFLQIVIVVFIGNSLFAQNKRKEKEISTAKKLEYIADSLLNEKEYKDAIDKYYKSAIIFEKNKQWLDAVKNYRQTSWCYLFLTKIDSSQYFIDNSYDLLSRKIKTFNEQEKLEKSEIFYTQARIYYRLKEFDSTFYYLEKGFEIANELNTKNNSHNLLIAKYYQTFGTTNYFQGNYDASLKYNFQALNLRQKELEPNNKFIITSYYNIALVYRAKRDYKKASQNLEYIINNCPKENKTWIASSYHQLGIIYKQTKEYYKTIEYYKNAIEIYKAEEGDNSLKVASVLNSLAKVYILLEDFENALENLKLSINIKKKCLGKNHPSLLDNLLSLGEYHHQLGEYEDAIKIYLEALGILDKNQSTDKLLKKQLYNLIGLTYLALNENFEAANYFQKAMCEIIDGFDYNKDLRNPELFFNGTNILNTKFEILSKSPLYNYLINKAIANNKIYKQNTLNINNLKQSFDTYLLAFQLLDNIRLEISDDESKFILSENEKVNYKDAINVCLKLDSLFPEKQYAKYTIELIDKCKSSSLRDKSYIANALNNSNIPEELIEKETELAQKLAFYRTEINKYSQKSEINIKEYKNTYNKLAIEYDTLCNYFEKTYPKYYNITHYNDFNIDALKANIKENEIIIEYFVTNSNILITTINNKNYEIIKVPIDNSFKENVLEFYKSIRKVEISNYININSVLYEKLIEPVKDRIAYKKSLIIIPDDYLFYIPFETLYKYENSGNNIDFRNLNYLIKKFDIRYNYSLNLWKFNKNLTNKENLYKCDFIGFAPVFEEADNLALANQNDNDTIIRSVVIDGKRFSKLKYTEKEINEISNLFLNNKKKTITFFYNKATEDNFKNNLSGYKYIHISSHGFSDENNPNLSGLAFYNSKNLNNNDSINIEDGLLYSSEISSLDLNADLVVLSSCEGGIGKLVEGEGLIAINRSFINSGVPNIIYSLWNVIDKNTSDFMIEFYKEILLGSSYSQALRKVKIKMIENTNTSHPKIWSGFVLVGI